MRDKLGRVCVCVLRRRGVLQPVRSIFAESAVFKMIVFGQ